MDNQVSSGLRTTFLIHFIVGLITGLPYLLIPETWGELVNYTIEDPFIVRILGAAIIGFAAASWLAYRETAWERVKIVVQMEIIWTILGSLVSLWGVLFAGLPGIIWLNLVILALFAVAFSYFYFRR